MHIRLFLFFLSFIVLASAHIFFIEFYLYWKYLWIDIPMHILGGVVVALGISILPFLGIRAFEKRFTVPVVIALVLVVGIAWEIFEIVAVTTLSEPGFWTDTIGDLCMDAVGACIGYGIVKSIKM